MSTTESRVRPPWMLIAAGTPVRRDAPVRRQRVFIQIIAGAILVIVAVALVGVVAARRLAEAEAVNDAAKTADLLADSVVQPALADGLLTGDAAAFASMDSAIREHVLGHSIVRVKIWDSNGRIVYSDEPALVGQTFPLGDEELAVFSNPVTRADISDLTAPENRFEQGNLKLLEAYRPVWTPTGSELLFETYFKYDDVTERSAQLWRGFAGVTLSSILLLVVLMMPILWRLLDRLNRSQAQREALLQRALDASTEERRRIAGALHDGVVQDLAATSFTVAGAAERAASLGQPALANDLRSAAGTVRTSIGGLRSLLVDIYPASLAAAGLAAALDDLAASVRSRGMAVTVDVQTQTGLDQAGERLVFRVAQECLNNVARHAAATTVSLRLRRTDEYVQLEIDDDGVGFDAATKIAHPEEGHFGLRILGDVVAVAGAELWLASAPGAGTQWQLRVPLS
jgi:two-component system NarL family sensor kinase